MLQISLVAEQLLTSQELVGSMDLVSWLVFKDYYSALHSRRDENVCAMYFVVYFCNINL
jgi:hypothetical protein